MSNVNSSFEPETILLREALRRVVLRRGEIGEQVVKRWEGKSDQKLTAEDRNILDADAKTILAVLKSGKLKAMYSPGKSMLLKKVKDSVWNSCKMDNIHWRLSAIREKKHDPMFEDIEVNAAEFERAILQREEDIGTRVAKTGHSIPLLEHKNAGINLLNKQIIRKKIPQSTTGTRNH